ncbi:hypothetical protein DESC_660107 [Desulfosarcina cetonica]|nr:hypothetical protein DESC_660107 [Desulfosarcina cetonica]
MLAGKAFGQHHQDHRNQHDQGGQGMNLGRHPATHRRENEQWQGLGFGPGGEEADHEIIQGQGEGQHRAGDDSRREQGQRDAPQNIPIAGEKIPGGLLHLSADGHQSAAHHQGHEGDLKGDVTDDHVEQARLENGRDHAQEPEHHDQGGRQNDIGNHHRDMQDHIQQVAGPAAPGKTIQGNGQNGSQKGGHEGGDDGQHQGVARGFEDPFVLEELEIPFQGEALPYQSAPGVVDREDRHAQQGQVEKTQGQVGKHNDQRMLASHTYSISLPRRR